MSEDKPSRPGPADSADSASSTETDPVNATLTTQVGPYTQSRAEPGVVNLGLGQPSPRLLPLAMIREAAARQLGPGADPLLLQYGAIRGYEGALEALAALITARYRHPARPEQLMFTGGISSALSMVSQLLAAPGQAVVCSDPTYFLARGIFESQHLRIVGIPADDQGLDVERLEHGLERDGLRPAFVYCIPSFHNPRGVDLHPGRARRLVELAERYDFVVVADEPYVMLHFGSAPPPCLMAYDGGRGRVLSLGSFSKILAPGLRLGWAHAEPALLERLCQHGALRSGGGLNPMVCAIVHGVLASGEQDRHIDTLRQTLAERSQALTAALRHQLPQARFEPPRGGYFVWLELPAGIDTSAALETSSEHGVRFTPGARCAIDRDLRSCLRLSFAFYEPLELELGAQRLARLLRISAGG